MSRFTLVHELDGAPKLAALTAGEREAEGAGGGWAWVLSDLKTLPETGATLRDQDTFGSGIGSARGRTIPPDSSSIGGVARRR